MKEPLVILTGPTAAGKTALSIRLAKAIGGEIISADSMQVYRKMNIGTAKILPEEMEGVPHHLIDILDPDESFDVTRFASMAAEAAALIRSRGHIPIVTGGTGFYIQALLYDVQFSAHDREESYRAYLQELAVSQGPGRLHAMLEEVDPAYAASVHENNVKRVIRALEFYHETGQRLSDHNESMHRRQPAYRSAYFVLYHERDILYERINRRVDQMMEKGLAGEVESLAAAGYGPELTSMQGLGYKEFFPYFEGKCSLEEVVETIKRDTRHFAKRQMTWFRREKDVIWLSKTDRSEDEILAGMLTELESRGIIG